MSPQSVDAILEHLANQDRTLGEIKSQVKDTNGRVKSLEIWQARIEGAKWAVSWVPPLVTAVASGALGALLASLLS